MQMLQLFSIISFRVSIKNVLHVFGRFRFLMLLFDAAIFSILANLAESIVRVDCLYNVSKMLVYRTPKTQEESKTFILDITRLKRIQF